MARALEAWGSKRADESVLRGLDRYQAADLVGQAVHEMDKIQPRVEKIMCEAKTVQDKFSKFKIELKVEELIGAVKNGSVSLASAAMRAALLHLSEDKT